MNRVLILPIRIHGAVTEIDSYKITNVIIRAPDHLLYTLSLPHPPTVGLANLV